jgi:S1-C subfamily serine protease
MAALSAELAAAAAGVAPSIVEVLGRTRRAATGIVIGAGRVIMGAHSVDGDEGLKIRTQTGQTVQAAIVGVHPAADLALLQADGLDAPALTFDTEQAGVGSLALLSGRSSRGDARARLTMISGVTGPVQMPDGSRLDRLLVLSWSPYPGFSGSAVTAVDGTLLGMATAALFRGTAVAVPTGVLQPAIDEIVRHGGVRRGFLGVSTQPVRVPERQRHDASAAGGLLILGLSEDGPADRAGLMVGDIMIEAGGAPLAMPEDLLALLTGDRVGRPLDVRVLRGGTMQTTAVTIGERPRRH